MADPAPPKTEPDAEPGRKRPRPADDEARVWRRMEWFQRQIETLWQERDALARRVAELERARDAEGRVMEYVDARFATIRGTLLSTRTIPRAISNSCRLCNTREAQSTGTA
jgi:hypothetical protein